MVRDDKLKPYEKIVLVENFDRVLGLNLAVKEAQSLDVPSEVADLVNKREEFRKNKDWQKSDEMRKEIEGMGYKVSDFADGVKVEKIK